MLGAFPKDSILEYHNHVEESKSIATKQLSNSILRFCQQKKEGLPYIINFISTEGGEGKSYVIEAVLQDSKSENLDVVFNKSITAYQSYAPGSQQYHKQYAKRMTLKGKINNALLRDYSNQKQTVNHFFDTDRPIPIWAVFESLTLGEFGTFFACANANVKLKTSSILHLPSNLDSDGKITEYMIYAVKDLRNAVAHNNTIFDTRFQTSTINKRLISLLETEVGITGLDFKYIDAYIILITYILRKMGETKTACKQFVSSFIDCTDLLRTQISPNICNQILGTQQRAHLNQLQNFVTVQPCG